MKEHTRPEVLAMLEAGNVRHISVGHVSEVPNHVQVNHLGLCQDGYIKPPITLNGGISGRASNAVPKLGEHNNKLLQ